MYADGFGIRPVLRETAREPAGHGYHVLAPNVFYRQGPAPVIELPECIVSDAGACLRFLTNRPEAAAGPVAVTGYRVGGLLATRTAAAHPGQGAAFAAFA